jgi:hypothetical protein
MTVPALVRDHRRLVIGSVAARLVLAGCLYALLALTYRAVSGGTGRPPLLDVLLATAAVTGVEWTARPLLDRLLRTALLGPRAAGHEAMQGLLHRMTTTLPVDEVVPRVAEAASRTTGRPSAEVRLWVSEGERWSQGWPLAPAGERSAVRHSVGVRYAGSEVGEIAVEVGDEQLSPVERRLLDDLAGPAGLALSTVRLTLQLRQRKAELERLTGALEASRNRLLSARSVEQRRLRGEVATRVTTHVSAALAALDGGSYAVERAGAEAALALDALRVIARGIYPPRLADQGYSSSVDGWLLRSGIHARLDLGAGAAALRAEPALEACLYFCTVTVLAALDAAGATDLGVALDDGSRVTLRVSGRGGGPVEADALLVVTDRIDAFDGTVVPLTGAGLVGVLASLPRLSAPTPVGPASSGTVG